MMTNPGCRLGCNRNRQKIAVSGHSCERYSWLDHLRWRITLNLCQNVWHKSKYKDTLEDFFLFFLLTLTLSGKFISLVASIYSLVLQPTFSGFQIRWKTSISLGICDSHSRLVLLRHPFFVDLITTGFLGFLSRKSLTGLLRSRPVSHSNKSHLYI